VKLITSIVNWCSVGNLLLRKLLNKFVLLTSVMSSKVFTVTGTSSAVTGHVDTNRFLLDRFCGETGINRRLKNCCSRIPIVSEKADDNSTNFSTNAQKILIESCKE
jgi:hypothetical protein